CAARCIAHGAIAPEVVPVVQVDIAIEKVCFGSTVVDSHTNLEEHEETLFEQRLVGLAVGVQNEVARSSEKVIAKTQATTIVPQVLNVHAFDHRRFIIPRTEPRKTCLGG